MHESGSFLRSFVERVRSNLDEADIDARYTDSYIVRYVCGPSLVDVLSRLSNTYSSPVVLSHQITLDEDVRQYPLPPCVQTVLNLRFLDDEGRVMADLRPRSHFSRLGVGWALAGNAGSLTLTFNEAPEDDQVAEILYTPNGDMQSHYGTGTLARVDGTARIELALTPTLGLLDRRENAYAGQVLRILSTSPAPIGERLISRTYYEASKWYAEVDDDFPSDIADGSITYEIVPSGDSAFWEATSFWAALKLGGKHLSDSFRGHLTIQYRAAIKTIGDNLTNIQGRMPKSFEKDTLDNDMDDLLWFHRTPMTR